MCSLCRYNHCRCHVHQISRMKTKSKDRLFSETGVPPVITPTFHAWGHNVKTVRVGVWIRMASVFHLAGQTSNAITQ